MWQRQWEQVIPFFAYPPQVRRIIYATNAIESMHMQLRKIVKNRGHFPSDRSELLLRNKTGSRLTRANRRVRRRRARSSACRGRVCRRFDRHESRREQRIDVAFHSAAIAMQACCYAQSKNGSSTLCVKFVPRSSIDSTREYEAAESRRGYPSVA
ncbi:Transposase (plasmid) [Mycetohabitans rhizoxinica HKI 454]|uniref:Mutator family transposase n=1 Tax=Mycetohabitans rhizoxinica (strain DSM 19002 / CIP 109453 / HKI 454) TaxID=882378 RepID=E5AV34_MYCRK|nr:Transposase [Mycetohabitans rhizoxinica HKI 454]